MAWIRETVRSLLRERLLDTAGELVAAEGFDRLRMTQVAAVAGVSRQTVYNEFGSKDALGEALFGRELERCLLGIRQHLDAHRADPRAAAEAAALFTLRLAGGNPLARAMLTAARDGEDGLLAHLTTRAEPVFETASAMLDAYAAEVWPAIDPDSRALAADTVVRLTASHVVQGAATPEDSARRIAEVFVRVTGLAG
ncbi:TetR family transcriptional regulator [Kitasatospora sp. NPDC088134]|uniref:TetR family transcriptional regulator n=1 Tax=Kitasatospora sp. NPDC088134 TaxID=3364071 RepID=UPI003830E928